VKLCPYACLSGALLGLLSFLVLSCASMEKKAPAEPQVVAPYKVKVIPEPAHRREAIIRPGECF
jgi:hypothetical protein